MVAMTAAAPVHRAGVEAGSATDAFEAVPEIGASQVPAAAIVDEHDMHLLPWTRTFEMTGIGCYRLSRRTAGKQAEENSQVEAPGDQFFNSHGRNMYIREMHSHIRVALIRTNDELACLRDGEVDSRQRRAAREEFLPQVQAGGLREELGIGIAFRRTEVFMKKLPDLFFFPVDTGEDDMTGRLVCQLYHPFAEVRVDNRRR